MLSQSVCCFLDSYTVCAVCIRCVDNFTKVSQILFLSYEAEDAQKKKYDEFTEAIRSTQISLSTFSSLMFINQLSLPLKKTQIFQRASSHTECCRLPACAEWRLCNRDGIAPLRPDWRTFGGKSFTADCSDLQTHFPAMTKAEDFKTAKASFVNIK